MKQLLTLFLLWLSLTGQAQNFKFMDLNDTTHFRTEDGMILHAYIDHYKAIGADTMFYMNREFAATKLFFQDTCAYDSAFASWMADSVYKSASSLTFFHPNFGFSVNLTASLNHFNVSGYQYQVKNDFRSTCTGIRQTGTEIIRTYNIEALDSLFNPSTLQKDSLIVEISSTRGLLRFPCLSSQHPEYFHEDPFYKTMDVFNFEPLTGRSLHNYAVGDEFHWLESGTGPSEPIRVLIVNREDFTDSVRYTFEKQRDYYTLTPNPGGWPPYIIDTTGSFNTNTITFTNLDTPISTVMNYLNSDGAYWWSFAQDICGHERLVFNTFWPHVYAFSSPACLSMAFEPGQQVSIIMEGIYEAFSWQFNDPGTPGISGNLVYQNTAAGSCGQAVKFLSTGLTDIQKLSFYPNPARQYIRFDCNKNAEPFEIRIYNLSGERVLSQGVSPETPAVNIKSLPAGMYMLQSEKGNSRLIKN